MWKRTNAKRKPEELLCSKHGHCPPALTHDTSVQPGPQQSAVSEPLSSSKLFFGEMGNSRPDGGLGAETLRSSLEIGPKEQDGNGFPFGHTALLLNIGKWVEHSIKDKSYLDEKKCLGFRLPDQFTLGLVCVCQDEPGYAAITSIPQISAQNIKSLFLSNTQKSTASLGNSGVTVPCEATQQSSGFNLQALPSQHSTAGLVGAGKKIGRLALNCFHSEVKLNVPSAHISLAKESHMVTQFKKGDWDHRRMIAYIQKWLVSPKPANHCFQINKK